MAIEAKGTSLQSNTQRNMTEKEKQFHSVKQLIAGNMKAISSVLPAHIKPERLARIAITTIQKNPKLLECTPESFIGSLLQCAALGLEPDGTLGHAYLVPFKDKSKGMICTMIPGYRGLVKLARQSGDIATIDAHEVSAGDVFDYRYGTDPMLRHVPAECPLIDGENGKMLDPNWRPGVITHFYAVAKFKDGTSQFVVMPVLEVNDIRDNSQGYKAAKNFGWPNPWDDHYVEMGKKTAIRRGSKMWPASVDKDNLFQKVANMDEQADAGMSPNYRDIIDVELIGETTTPQVGEEGKRAKAGAEQPKETEKQPTREAGAEG